MDSQGTEGVLRDEQLDDSGVPGLVRPAGGLDVPGDYRLQRQGQIQLRRFRRNERCRSMPAGQCVKKEGMMGGDSPKAPIGSPRRGFMFSTSITAPARVWRAGKKDAVESPGQQLVRDRLYRHQCTASADRECEPVGAFGDLFKFGPDGQ